MEKNNDTDGWLKYTDRRGFQYKLICTTILGEVKRHKGKGIAIKALPPKIPTFNSDLILVVVKEMVNEGVLIDTDGVLTSN